METNNAVAKTELRFINGKPKINRFWDALNQKNMDILKCIDVPQKGIQVCATIGLNSVDIGLVTNNIPLRVELIGACDIKITSFENMVASSAFEIMDSHTCFPGYIITNVIKEYIPDCEMEHFLLTNPFLWEKAKSIIVNNICIAWLMIVPISHQEYKYACCNGVEALELVFEREDIDIYNIYRKSVI